MSNPDFLKNKYSLHNAPEVESASERTEKRTGEKVPQNPSERIQNYLDRFKEIIERKDLEDKKMGVESLKKVLFDKFLTKYEEIPESYWKSQENIIRERGQLGDWQNASEEQKIEIKKQTAESQLADQKASLEQWIDYFTSSDSEYMPDYLKYWAFRSVINLQEYNKDKKEFNKRSKRDVKMFPDLNQEALSYVVDSVIKKYQNQSPEFNHDIQQEEREKFQEYLKQENFSNLYAWAVEQINPIPEHLMKIVEGEWIKYKKDSDHKPLVKSIQGKGTGWCTAGENTAKTQLNMGDFHVYYSLDEEQKPTIPRIAIRMENEKIAEVRGVAFKQNLDPYVGDVLKGKLEEFPDKDEYLKKEADMKQLTEIDKKLKDGQELDKNGLRFLYEIDSKIQGFGYKKDPRIEEIKKTRNSKQDALIVFECESNQIAYQQEDINENTKVYIGPLFPNIFQLNIEHIYTSFPEGKIRIMETTIGGKTKQELIQKLKQNKIKIYNSVQQMIDHKDFITSKKQEHINLILLTIKDLGLDNPTIQKIYQRAEELGLELCPAETGPNLRLNYLDQPSGEFFMIAMKGIFDAVTIGSLHAFGLVNPGIGLFLNDNSYSLEYNGWSAGDKFVFRLRKKEA